jgi:DNA-binding transcriptional regulator YhcF (GntR family)
MLNQKLHQKAINNMKITKLQLKKIIAEELPRLAEGDVINFHTGEETVPDSTEASMTPNLEVEAENTAKILLDGAVEVLENAGYSREEIAALINDLLTTA